MTFLIGLIFERGLKVHRINMKLWRTKYRNTIIIIWAIIMVLTYGGASSKEKPIKTSSDTNKYLPAKSLYSV